ncbi:MAG TPA: HIT family protein [archaeon]|nr:HIT family protein [archaeon]
MADCIFCRIVKGEIPSARIFESRNVLAFLDISPAARGHALVIPKKHFETLSEIPKKDLQELVLAVQEVARQIVILVGADGFNVIQSNKKSAGQVIPHLHFHIIPRTEGDALNFDWQHIEQDKEELAAFGKSLKQKLRKRKK